MLKEELSRDVLGGLQEQEEWCFALVSWKALAGEGSNDQFSAR
jgi:hypothetical protein